MRRTRCFFWSIYRDRNWKLRRLQSAEHYLAQSELGQNARQRAGDG